MQGVMKAALLAVPSSAGKISTKGPKGCNKERQTHRLRYKARHKASSLRHVPKHSRARDGTSAAAGSPESCCHPTTALRVTLGAVQASNLNNKSVEKKNMALDALPRTNKSSEAQVCTAKCASLELNWERSNSPLALGFALSLMPRDSHQLVLPAIHGAPDVRMSCPGVSGAS